MPEIEAFEGNETMPEIETFEGNETMPEIEGNVDEIEENVDEINADQQAMYRAKAEALLESCLSLTSKLDQTQKNRMNRRVVQPASHEEDRQLVITSAPLPPQPEGRKKNKRKKLMVDSRIPARNTQSKMVNPARNTRSKANI